MDDAGYAERKVYHAVISFVTVQLAERIFFSDECRGNTVHLAFGRPERQSRRPVAGVEIRSGNEDEKSR